MDFGAHTSYVLAAYGVSLAALTGLILLRLDAFRKARKAEEEAGRD